MLLAGIAWASNAAMAADESEVYIGDDLKGTGGISKSFAKDLGAIGFHQKLRACQEILLIRVGNGMPQQNESYGAICTFSGPKEPLYFMVCNDRMVGHLALNHVQKIQNIFVSSTDVPTFTRSNCYGG